MMYQPVILWQSQTRVSLTLPTTVWRRPNCWSSLLISFSKENQTRQFCPHSISMIFRSTSPTTEMKSDDGAMRVRTKDCHVCNDPKQFLYRCRYDDLKDWVFLCGKCLTDVKTRSTKTYQYGGTWKSKKRWISSMVSGVIHKSTKFNLLNHFRGKYVCWSKFHVSWLDLKGKCSLLPKTIWAWWIVDNYCTCIHRSHPPDTPTHTRCARPCCQICFKCRSLFARRRTANRSSLFRFWICLWKPRVDYHFSISNSRTSNFFRIYSVCSKKGKTSKQKYQPSCLVVSWATSSSWWCCCCCWPWSGGAGWSEIYSDRHK